MTITNELPDGQYTLDRRHFGPAEVRVIDENDLGSLVLIWQVSQNLNSGKRTGAYEYSIINRIGKADAAYHKNRPEAGPRMKCSVSAVRNNAYVVQTKESRYGEGFRPSCYLRSTGNETGLCEWSGEPLMKVARRI